jgi:hypothetical protein
VRANGRRGDPETTINGIMQVDVEKVREAEPKRDRKRD